MTDPYTPPTTEAKVRQRAAVMRTRANYSDHYGTYRREMDYADKWERDHLAALRTPTTPTTEETP